MRAALFACLLVLAGCTGTPGTTPGAAPTSPTEAPADAETPTALECATRRNASTATDATLLSMREAFAAVEGSCADQRAVLYYVAANGTWFHAASNGSVGTRAPSGNVVPGVKRESRNGTSVNETVDLTDERPIYVWKVWETDHCPGPTVLNATGGETIATYPIPACSPPRPSPTAEPKAVSAAPASAGL